VRTSFVVPAFTPLRFGVKPAPAPNLLTYSPVRAQATMSLSLPSGVIPAVRLPTISATSSSSCQRLTPCSSRHMELA
jgi:hypothetical protein